MKSHTILPETALSLSVILLPAVVQATPLRMAYARPSSENPRHKTVDKGTQL